MKQVVKTTRQSEIALAEIKDLSDFDYGIWVIQGKSVLKVNQLYYNQSNDIRFGTNNIAGSVYCRTDKSLTSLLDYHVSVNSVFIPESKAELLEFLGKHLT